MQACQLWKKLFSEKHLYEHYNEKIKNRPSIGMDKITPSKFEQEITNNIEVILRKIQNDTYHFTRYKQLLFLKGSEKPPRVVSVPTLRDKLTTSVLDELLYGVYGDKCRTQMPHCIINKLSNEIGKYDCFIKIDIKSFYGSINHDKLLEMLSKRIRKKEILSLITKAIKTSTIANPVKDKVQVTEREKGIPEGLPISNALANIFMMNLDEKYEKYKSIFYCRYVDDILLLVTSREFNELNSEIESDIKELNLEINEKKDEGYITKGLEYLGYRILPNEVTVRKSSVLKIELSIEELFRELRGDNIKYIQWKLNLKITGFILDSNKYGWLFYYSQITDESLLFHLDYVVNKLVKRYGMNNKMKLKRFERTYCEIRKALHTTRYIPNMDNMTIDEKRQLLSDIYGIDFSDKNNERVEIQFRRIMKKELRDIEKDIQNIS